MVNSPNDQDELQDWEEQLLEINRMKAQLLRNQLQEQLLTAPPPRKPEKNGGFWIIASILVVAIMGVATLGALSGQISVSTVDPSAATDVAVKRPTLAPNAIAQLKRDAAGKGQAVEDRALQPTATTAPAVAGAPELQPTAPQVAPVGTTIDMLCPDGVYRPACPAPTEPSVLTAQQQQDVQNTDSVLNSLNSAESTMTEAQKMVAQHDAEWNVRNMQATATAQAVASTDSLQNTMDSNASTAKK